MNHRFVLTLTLSTALVAGMAATVTHAATVFRPCTDPQGADCLYLPPKSSPHGPQALVTAYFAALDAGMARGDFSSLVSLFAPGATLTRNDPDGTSLQVHGLSRIAAFYWQLRATHAGSSWTQDAMRALSSTVVLSYEHVVAPSLAIPERCSHLFVIHNGKITRVDDTTFYPGQH